MVIEMPVFQRAGLQSENSGSSPLKGIDVDSTIKPLLTRFPLSIQTRDLQGPVMSRQTGAPNAERWNVRAERQHCSSCSKEEPLLLQAPSCVDFLPIERQGCFDIETAGCFEENRSTNREVASIRNRCQVQNTVLALTPKDRVG